MPQMSKDFSFIVPSKTRAFLCGLMAASDAHVNGIRPENAGPVPRPVFTNLPASIPSPQTPCEGGARGPHLEMKNA